MNKEILGIDIGGTGIKLGITDIESGELTTERFKYLTPKPATPEAVSRVIKLAIQERFPDYQGPIGCGFPAIIKNGVALSATNVDQSWFKLNIEEYLSKELASDVYVANDADVAGFAEINFGAKEINKEGLTIFLTVGTGIGSALFYNGIMIPNSELGHLWYKNTIYERHVSNVARKNDDLTWDEWGQRLNIYLSHLNRLFSPNMVVIGGGISKKFSKFSNQLDLPFPVIPASLQNEAGVVGASVYAYDRSL